MEAFLNALLPKMLPDDVTFDIYPYQGKHALMRKIGNRLKGYATWLPPEYRLVVIVDRDNDDCEELKARLEYLCNDAGLRSRHVVGNAEWQVVTRLAIEELEAWYFGDWTAVCAAYPRISPKIPGKARYRDPDAITGGTWEAFEKVLQKHGYFKHGLAKKTAAADIGNHADPAANRSHSFTVFRDAIAEAVI